MKLNFKKFDYIIIAVIAILLVLALFVCVGKKKISKTPVLSENTVVFQVFFRGITLSSLENEPFIPMDESFITIRNVPHKKVTIIDARKMPRLTIVSDSRGNSTMVQDVSTPFMYDCLVTLYDDAKITDDGPVLGGNKLKIGLPIILEGKNYRFSGTISDLNILNEKEANELKNLVAEEKEKINNSKNKNK